MNRFERLLIGVAMAAFVAAIVSYLLPASDGSRWASLLIFLIGTAIAAVAGASYAVNNIGSRR